MRRKIEWNKVTMYSKVLAAAVFILLPLVFFYFGVKIGLLIGSAQPNVNIYMQKSAPEASGKYLNNDLGFSVEYPAGWTVREGADPYTLAAIEPSGSSGANAVKLFLYKNSYKDISALKSVVDKRVSAEVKSEVRHGKLFDSLFYSNVNGSAVMYVPISDAYILGMSGPDDVSTWHILDSFEKL